VANEKHKVFISYHHANDLPYKQALLELNRRFGLFLDLSVDKCEAEGPIVITRNGRAAAVLLAPVNDEDLESLLLARSPRLQALLAKSRASIQAGKGLSSSDFWKAAATRRVAQSGRTQKGLRPTRRRRTVKTS
jgi:PHD/YefM family antitoxin component YafN of YafNO toxin-antitoxin module